jgi:hypothetical protein
MSSIVVMAYSIFTIGYQSTAAAAIDNLIAKPARNPDPVGEN